MQDMQLSMMYRLKVNASISVHTQRRRAFGSQVGIFVRHLIVSDAEMTECWTDRQRLRRQSQTISWRPLTADHVHGQRRLLQAGRVDADVGGFLHGWWGTSWWEEQSEWVPSGQLTNWEQVWSVFISQHQAAAASGHSCCRCTWPHRRLLWSAGGLAGAQPVSKCCCWFIHRLESLETRRGHGTESRAERVVWSRELWQGVLRWSPPAHSAPVAVNNHVTAHTIMHAGFYCSPAAPGRRRSAVCELPGGNELQHDCAMFTLEWASVSLWLPGNDSNLMTLSSQEKQNAKRGCINSVLAWESLTENHFLKQ